MTKPSEVTVIDAECDALENWLDLTDKTPYWREKTRQALAAFLAARVPDERPREFGDGKDAAWQNNRLGFNACRAAVLRGPE